MTSFDIIEVGRMIVCSHILLFLGLILPPLRSWDRVYIGMIGFGAVAFYLVPVLFNHNAHRLLMFPFVVLQAGMTFWLWMFAHATRDSSFKPRIWHWVILLLKLIVTVFFINAFRNNIFSFIADEMMVLHFIIPVLFNLILIVAAVFVAGHHLNDELDDSARRLRQLFIYYSAGAFLLSLMVFVVKGSIGGYSRGWLGVLFGMIIIINLHLLYARSLKQKKRFVLANLTDTAREADITIEDRALSIRITECFTAEEYFRVEGLTVTMLAEHLAEKEYKVRVAINQVLGYRNFNVFLNEYRIAAAKNALLENLELPVLQLSMDLGYRSLAGFNKAFKDNTGLTPTEYRRQNNQH